jgi:cellulose synthase/poly-beta-1,6-N-acetylglucosamine synthase-like glycosyltransferase
MRILILCLLPLWTILLADGGLKLFFLGVRLRQRPESEERAEVPVFPAHFLSFALVIPAHNEERVIGETVRQLRTLHYPPERFAVIVIADGCTDKTARFARENGATCTTWMEQTGRKGRALSQFLAQNREQLSPFDVLVVCDADTRLHPNALLFFNQAFLDGMEVGQGKVQSDPYFSTPLSALVASSETLSQEVDDLARSTLGWPVPLRGTGMAFRREVFLKFGPLPHTRSEDLELSLILTRCQIQAIFVPEAIAYDPKPTEVAAAAKQRARWLQGHGEVVQRYWREILAVFRTGNWGERALLFSLLLRPRTFVIGVKMLVLCGCFLLPARGFFGGTLLIAIGMSLSLIADLVYYSVGAALCCEIHTKGALWRAILYLPVWAGAVVLSLVSTKKWLSVRDRGEEE